jgi:hypothetical protein
VRALPGFTISPAVSFQARQQVQPFDRSLTSPFGYAIGVNTSSHQDNANKAVVQNVHNVVVQP